MKQLFSSLFNKKSTPPSDVPRSDSVEQTQVLENIVEEKTQIAQEVQAVQEDQEVKVSPQVKLPNKRKAIIQIIIFIACIILYISYYFEEQEKNNATNTNAVSPKKASRPIKKPIVIKERIAQPVENQEVNQAIKEQLQDIQMPQVPLPKSVEKESAVDKEEKEKLEASNEDFLDEFIPDEKTTQELSATQKDDAPSEKQIELSPAPMESPLDVLPNTQIQAPDGAVEKQTEQNEQTQTPPPTDMDYAQLGRGLVYNCAQKHYACLNQVEYLKCREWEKNNSSCKPIDVYKTHKDCTESQSARVHDLTNVDCNSL